ncbi:MAG: hypothetical protein IJY50_08205 [Clostridia bacterium]|nr:hypothetical protein [Clostridia bacterium]
MIAGFAEREYTPAEGPVPGQIKVGYAKGKRTPLMAHVAVMEGKGGGAVLVSLDILFVSVAFATKMRRRISELTHIPTEQILIACSHTHTGCAIDLDCWAFRGSPDNLIPVENSIMEAVKEAWATRRNVKMGVATGFDARFNFCRDFYTTDGYIVMNPGHQNADKLVKPYAAVDHSVNVMRFDELDGTPRCFVVNYANHLDTGGGAPKEKSFSADYAGYLRLALQKAYGKDVTVLFLNGCCANVNHYDYKYGSDRTGHCRPDAFPSVEIGEGLAETIQNITPALVSSDEEFRIEGKSRMHLTARRSATRAQKEWAMCVKNRVAAGEEVSLRRVLLADLYLTDQENLPTTVDLEIQVLQIGPWTIVGLPGEIYSDIGLKIKANSPFANTVVVELANGTHGYMAPDIVQESGCYEGTYSNVAYTGHGTAKVLIDGATNLLNALFESDNVLSFGGFRNASMPE